MGAPFPRVNRPCDECPWRRDAEPGRFTAERYETLRDTVGHPGAEVHLGAPIFACHKTPDDAGRACASWLAVVGCEHLSIRVAQITGRLPAAALAPKPDWPPLYGSYQEMVDAQSYEGGA